MGSTMTIILGGIVLAVAQLAVGIVIGRHLRFPRGGRERFPLAATDLRTLTRRLYRLVTRVADDVGEHQTQIEQVTKEFSSMQSAAEPPLTEVFLATVTQAMKVNERLQTRLSAAEQRLQNQARQIETHISEARTDALTGLPNRRAFDDELNRRVAEWQRKQTQFSLIMIDVDHFKALNDRCGHPAGDEILRQLAKVLRLTFREMDMVARFGGEEFATILPSTSLNDGTRAAERVRKAVANFEFQLGQSILQMTISLGLAAADAEDDSASLVRKADEALYASKHGGRNCGYFHTGQTCRRIPASSPLNRARWNGNVAPCAPDNAELQSACDDLRSTLGQLLDET